MTTNPANLLAESKPLDSAYLKIWEVKQEHSRTLWTVTILFLGVSFAVLCFSFADYSITNVQKIVSVMLYWLAYVIFCRFYTYNSILEAQLKRMETEKQVTFCFESDENQMVKSRLGKLLTPARMLFLYGMLYSAVVLLPVVQFSSGYFWSRFWYLLTRS